MTLFTLNNISASSVTYMGQTINAGASYTPPAASQAVFAGDVGLVADLLSNIITITVGNNTWSGDIAYRVLLILSSAVYSEQPNSWFVFGQVSTASTALVPVMKSSFTYTGANVYGYIASSSANDTLAGTGAQKITVTYFKADGSGPFTEVVNMLGVTGVFTANTMAFVQSVQVTQVGSGGTNAGTILLSNLSPLSTIASISPGDSETYYCHHFVPLGRTAYITQLSFGSAATAAGQGGKFEIIKQTIPLSTNAQLSASGVKALVGTSSSQNIIFDTPIKVVGPAVITVEITPNSATANTFYSDMGGFEE